MFTPPDPDSLPTTPLPPPPAPPPPPPRPHEVLRHRLQRFWHATRILRWVTASLLVLGGSIVLTRRLWPQAPLFIAVLVSVVLLAGLLLWGRHRHEPGAASGLGASLLGGVLVAVTVFVVQASFEVQRQVTLDREARERAAAEARQSLRFSLGAQQDFTGIDLAGQDLSGFYLRGKNFSDAVLTGANLRGAELTSSNLRGANLVDANLHDAIMNDADLAFAGLVNANLTGAEVTGADLTDAVMSSADLTGANLTGSGLTRANLVFTNLNGANLSYANLSAVTLSYTNLREADLTCADLTGTNLADADLRGAMTAGRTRWPAGFDPDAHGVVPRGWSGPPC